MSRKRHFISIKTTSKFNVETTMIWVDTKTNFVLLYQQTQHVQSVSKLRRHVNIDKFLRYFDMLFDVTSMNK